jgi:hypothetical protein
LRDKDGVGWKASRPFHQQDWVPSDIHLATKLGIAPGEKILFFAGCAGDWARALSDNAQVHYTDISPSMTALVKEHGPSKIRSFRTRPAELQPRRAGRFDWSFSFEPIPLVFDEKISLVVVRGLLNNKGVKIVYQKSYSALPEKLLALVKRIGSMYRVSIETKIVPVRGAGSVESSMWVLTVKTNSHARELARLDLKVLQLLNAQSKKGNLPSQREIASRVSAPLSAVRRCRRRLEAITPILNKVGT